MNEELDLETLDSVVIAEVSELKDYGFMFPIDISKSIQVRSDNPRFTDKFCQVRSYDGKSHKGVDIACGEGTPVYAVSGGVVTTSRLSSSAGNYIVINHGEDAEGRKVESIYMHNSQLKVSEGQTVEKGELIALSGNTGQSSGPHSHFQIEINDVCYNPIYAYDLVEKDSEIFIKTLFKDNGNLVESEFKVPDRDYLEYIHQNPNGDWIRAQ